jgi:tRNA threonylcarbamoyladenosine biosynthesis protein TsaE
MQFEFSEIQKVAQSVLGKLVEKNTNILALHGDLGAGKTTFVGAIAKELGIVESIISPTFIVYRVYTIENVKYKVENTHNEMPWTKLVHIDAYRLTGEEDAKKLRLHELFADPTNLVCIEWPENVGAELPEHALHVHLAYTGEYERSIEIT